VLDLQQHKGNKSIVMITSSVYRFQRSMQV